MFRRHLIALVVAAVAMLPLSVTAVAVAPPLLKPLRARHPGLDLGHGPVLLAKPCCSSDWSHSSATIRT